MRISDWSSDVCSSDLAIARTTLDYLPNNGKRIHGLRVGLGRFAPRVYGAGMDAPTLHPATAPVAHRATHRVALYDMDRTITRAGTYSGFLIHVARRRQQWRLLLLPLALLAALAYALRLVDRAQLKAINLRLLVGKRRSEVRR